VEKPTKRKGKGKAKNTEPTNDEEMVFDEIVADEQEKVTRGALFSINVIDLKAPPLPMKQGPWNQRPVDPKEQKRLRESFKSQGIRSFDLDNALPLILAREHLHADAVNNTIGDPEQAPLLQLSAKGMAELKSLTFAGGHHRRTLVLKLWEECQKTLAAAEVKLEKKKKTLETKLGKGSKDPLEQLHGEIDELEQKILGMKRQTMWVVKVYDASKWSLFRRMIY
jgi:hypothetical protein